MLAYLDPTARFHARFLEVFQVWKRSDWRQTCRHHVDQRDQCEWIVTRLDLKYRPKKFAEVLGNERVVQLLLRRSLSGTLTDQSMLFGGPKGTGKTTLARIVAMAIVCSAKQEGEPCGKCSACIAIVNGTSSCVEELDAASQGTVDHVREMVQNSEYEPLDGIGNIYILDEAQRLSLASQDAMLRAVEDRSIIVIMCTTEPHKIRGSIRSRVEEYPVYAPSVEIMLAKLVEICDAEKIEHDPDALKLLCPACQNCPRVCIRAVETMAVSGPVDVAAVRSFLRFGDYEAVDKILARVDEQPKSAIQEFDALIDREGPVWVRDAMLYAVASGLRADVGAGHDYPCRVTFFQTRLRHWSEFARQIGVMERPTAAGLMAALLSTQAGFAPRAPTSLPGEIPVPTKTLEPIKTVSTLAAAVMPVVAKTGPEPLEINGINFSSTERLTTLDTKVNGKVEPVPEPDPQSAEFRPDMVPMSDREFARVFVNRFKHRH